ncbi:MAG TPA: cyclic nucleotide-binding domain-containing protein [Treponemataceae bacterium]|nr:cyclic nucleotide-binding domain-containing protein [Treponemataceae bacterium]
MLQLSILNFTKGSYLFVQGQAENDRFYIIQKGQVRCYKELEVDSTMNILGPGDFAGVIPCMAGQSQIETVVATSDVQAISVKKDQYPDLIRKNAPVAIKIIRTFAARMRFLNEKLAQLTLKNVTTITAEHLYTTATYYDKARQYNSAIYGYYQYMKECPKGPNVEKAKQRFIQLKPITQAVYYESTNETVRTYPKDTMIFSECQRGAEMFIIQGGQIKITKIVDNNEIILAVLKKGDFFGEMSLLENKPRSASAIAHDDCILMVINKNNFNIMVQSQPQLISRLTTTLAERLWTMSRQLTNTQLADTNQKLIDMLALQLEKNKIALNKTSDYQFDLTAYDLANMCGIPKTEQAIALGNFIQNPLISLVQNKIYVKNTEEIIKTAAFYRKQQQKTNTARTSK